MGGTFVVWVGPIWLSFWVGCPGRAAGREVDIKVSGSVTMETMAGGGHNGMTWESLVGGIHFDFRPTP